MLGWVCLVRFVGSCSLLWYGIVKWKGKARSVKKRGHLLMLNQWLKRGCELPLVRLTVRAEVRRYPQLQWGGGDKCGRCRL